MKFSRFLLLLLSILTFIISCNKKSEDIAFLPDGKAGAKADSANLKLELPKTQPKEVSQQFKDYWYAGEAEITSYQLTQARYGELREGKAAMIFVTEDFLPEIQVKTDNQSSKNIPVLKLNATKNFNTGIYPYSVMTSTFYPVFEKQHALKVSQSMQEWCGHVYAQLNNRSRFEITSHSYFQGEADQSFELDKTILENELWTQLRIDPASLPTGNLNIIPDFSYARMKHVPLKAYKAEASNSNGTYTLTYPKLNRTLTINYNKQFPHEINSWEETFKSGFGAGARELTTKATKIKSIKSPYWSKNSNKDEILREKLGLK